MAHHGPDPSPAAPDDLARQAAAEYLHELLLRPGRTRRTWEQYAERTRLGQVNQLAVAEVLARHLWQHPRRRGDGDLLPRQLKDTAARALSGRLLSRATLELFMDAFALPDAEQDQLWRLWEGSPRVRMLTGTRAIRPDTEERGGRISRPSRPPDGLAARPRLRPSRRTDWRGPDHTGDRGAPRRAGQHSVYLRHVGAHTAGRPRLRAARSPRPPGRERHVRAPHSAREDAGRRGDAFPGIRHHLPLPGRNDR